MIQKTRATAALLATATGLALLAPAAAHAGSKGRRNTAYALGAVGIYGIVKKKPVIAGLGVGGAIYSYMRSREAAKQERYRRKRHAYCRRHRSHYCRH